MEWYLEVFRKYATFSGRARRKEYWFFALFNFIISGALTLIDTYILQSSTNSGVGILGGLYGLAVLIPSLAVTVRRLHDTNHSGWWILINLIPFAGTIVMLVFLLTDSTAGENQYGPNPKTDMVSA